MWQDVKVTIRQFERTDTPKKVEWINNPENNRFLHYDIPICVEKTEKWFDSHIGEETRYDAVIEVDGTPVGTIGLLCIDRKNSKAEYYSTPPITLVGVVEYIKKRDHAVSYLLLKDIFPQNAVDIGLMSKDGVKGVLYKFFRWKEKRLYTVSDHIGCMSQANVDYVVKHNPEVDPKIVEICPNCIEVIDKSVDEQTRKQIRERYGIPLDKRGFVYGGNLGKPQGIPFLIKHMHKCKDMENVFFLIVGDGTEYGLPESYQNSQYG